MDTLPLPDPEPLQPDDDEVESIPPSQPHTDAFMLSDYVPPDSPESKEGDNKCPPDEPEEVDKLPIRLPWYMCMLDVPCCFVFCSWGHVDADATR